ncbi:MAG: hypothetical protein HY530_07370 [Chloroflexi bacterium]|nr:hypothetical protein [Chloroflexota bacterium]
MVERDNGLHPSRSAAAGGAEVIEHMARDIAGGRHWYLALLEAIGIWPGSEEVHGGTVRRYLIDGEAFDWLLLAERLCEAVDGLVPDAEKTDLLFHGRPPLDLTAEEFKELIGCSKYQQHLNYFYGVVVERALILATEAEVRKERLTLGLTADCDTLDEAHRRIYAATEAELLKRFRQIKRYRQLKSITLGELKEFTFWLFKYRLEHCDKARVASDTKKALCYLAQQQSLSGHPWRLSPGEVGRCFAGLPAPAGMTPGKGDEVVGKR